MSQLPPPMSPMSPVPQQGYAPYPQPMPQRTNGPAIASLVLGILGCIPILTGLLAVIFGIIGLKKTRDPQVGGKALAIVGLVLGLLSIASWGVFGGAMYMGYAASQPARAVANQFAIDLTTGNLPAAMAATNGMTEDSVSSVADNIKSWGPVQSTLFTGYSVRADAATGTVCDLGGLATFQTGGPKAYIVSLVKVNGTWKVKSFNFQ